VKKAVVCMTTNKEKNEEPFKRHLAFEGDSLLLATQKKMKGY
jgi:hypothetical protein